MKYFTPVFIFIFSFNYGQSSISKVLKLYNSEKIPYIHVEEASKLKSALFLDAREIEEYNTSHINGAMYVGYKEFDSNSISEKIADKNTPIVVYCSIGVRSEKIGYKLSKLGFTNVLNLYGGIFEWKNNGNVVVDNSGKETEEVHTYNKHWSKYLTKGTKIY